MEPHCCLAARNVSCRNSHDVCSKVVVYSHGDAQAKTFWVNRYISGFDVVTVSTWSCGIRSEIINHFCVELISIQNVANTAFFEKIDVKDGPTRVSSNCAGEINRRL